MHSHKEGCMPKNWCFWIVVLEKTLEGPMNRKETKPINPKGNHSWLLHWKDWCWHWSINTLATWWEERTHWKRLMLGKTEAGGEGGDRGWDGWMASLTQWTWVWANGRTQWRKGKPGVPQAMWSQVVRHDWMTEQQKAFRAFEHEMPILPAWHLSIKHCIFLCYNPVSMFGINSWSFFFFFN